MFFLRTKRIHMPRAGQCQCKEPALYYIIINFNDFRYPSLCGMVVPCQNTLSTMTYTNWQRHNMLCAKNVTSQHWWWQVSFVDNKSVLLTANQLCWWQVSFVDDKSELLMTSQLCWRQVSFVDDESALLTTFPFYWWQVSFVDDKSALLKISRPCGEM